MKSLLRGEPDVVIRWAGLLIAAGLLIGFVSAWLDLPGAITAVFAVSLGAAGGSLVAWQTERGLWMLAGLFCLLFVAIFGLVLFGRVWDLARGAAPADLGVTLDLGLAMLLLSSTMRFLWRVAQSNWAFSRRTGSDPAGPDLQ